MTTGRMSDATADLPPELLNDTDIYRVPTADYLTFGRLYYTSMRKYAARFSQLYARDYRPTSFALDLYEYCLLSGVDVVCACAAAVLWTRLRQRLTTQLFLPWAVKLELQPASGVRKVPESLWKLLFYSCSWLLSAYVVLFSGTVTIFNDPLSVWDDWHPRIDIPFCIRVVYMIQGSFYVHSLYATVYLDQWRKDSLAMMVHHVLTIALLLFSYGMRHHQAGMLVLFLHDISDVLLEITKMNALLKKRAGRTHAVHDVAANVSFCLFAASWFVCRLYLYPLKVMYMGSYGAVNLANHRVPGIPLFNSMLLLLLVMNAWWFHFIILFLYRAATGRMKEMEDTRELEEEEQRLKQANGTASHTNGAATAKPTVDMLVQRTVKYSFLKCYVKCKKKTYCIPIPTPLFIGQWLR